MYFYFKMSLCRNILRRYRVLSEEIKLTYKILCSTDFKPRVVPLSQGCRVVELEILATVEMMFLVEVIVDLSMQSGEFL